jgi:hypothetical protein
MRFIIFLNLILCTFLCNGQKTEIANVRTELDPNILQILVKYDLLNKISEDSIGVRFFADNKRIKSTTISGDIGYAVKEGPDRVIKWDFVKDGLKGNTKLIAEVYSIRPTVFNGVKGKVKLIGLAGVVGTGIYSSVLANKISKDVRQYNNAPDPSNASEQQILNQLKATIEKNKNTFYIFAGVTCVLLITDSFLFLKRKKQRQLTYQFTVPLGTPSFTLSKRI